MKMLKLPVPLFLSVCFAVTTVLPAMAQYTTGVKNGDWIKYDADISFSIPNQPHTHRLILSRAR
ncbi:MAG: hypothetical protein QXQ50_07665 [Candidatus Bathyarchaeia archaeon]